MGCQQLESVVVSKITLGFTAEVALNSYLQLIQLCVRIFTGGLENKDKVLSKTTLE